MRHRRITGAAYCGRIVSVLWLLLLLTTPNSALALRAVFLADTQGGKADNYGVNAAELEVALRAILTMQPKPDMVFCLGDLVQRGFTEDTGYQFELWKELMRPITQADIPLYVVKGNHELTRNRSLLGHLSPIRFFLSNQQEYAKAFAHMPANGPKAHEHLAYTVSDKATSTVFVTLDSQFITQDLVKNPYGISRGQLDWLRARLPAVDEAVHRIVLAHVPAFNPKNDQPEIRNKSFQHLWEIMEDKRVDLMIAGHLHISSLAVIDSAVYPASRRPIVQVVTGPVGGSLPSEETVRADPAVWNTRVGRNFLLLEIDGPKPEDPIKLTAYLKADAGEYTPVDIKTVYGSKK